MVSYSILDAGKGGNLQREPTPSLVAEDEAPETQPRGPIYST